MLRQYSINVYGLVQGVGFRPFIYRLALDMSINGSVSNCNRGVEILIQATNENCGIFIARIKREHPQASEITSITVEDQDIVNESNGFEIVSSHGDDMQITGISPDIAVCNKCMCDINDRAKRYKYAFVNCTGCGPRFSIIKSLPYDRNITTMNKFKLCSSCAAEFEDIDSRRFHTQPVCCNDCGPHYTMHGEGGTEIKDYEEILLYIKSRLNRNEIIAIKGVGGYNLICNPKSVKTVRLLRNIKFRKSKPFAVMFRDTDTIRKYAHLSSEEETLISSWRRPIVLLNQKMPVGKGINDNYRTIGAVLPYMPIHYHIFEMIKSDCLVFTSANIGDLPIISENSEAINLFSDLNIAVLSHNRDIYNRVDDSVTRFIANREVVIRRSRGYAPEPICVDCYCEGILALGGEMNSVFAIGKGEEVILSQYIGDTKNRNTALFYKEMLDHYFTMFRFKPQKIVCDCHPGYFSTKLAETMAQNKGIKLIKVNHHHAHTVAVMAEFNITGEVLSLSFDGIGYGDDGTLWGGELLFCTRGSYQRLMHLPQVAMPGGDAASYSPWRMAVSYLNAV
ncbi:MAG: carbamoyltransferase HypF, partial [Bacteroidales bacterium]